MNGSIEDILICENAGDRLKSVETALMIQGRGIEGDRYFLKQGTFSDALEEKGDFEVTLIEIEEIEAFNQETKLAYLPADFRRNIITKGIRLNDLIGREFKINDATLYGVRLCEPCAHLAGLLGDSIMSHMVHKAGLRAVIKKSGSIRLGSTIIPCEKAV